eukprot:m.310385 g.310385  ORF g.310385 m.310385 type:complete len:224 (+) comp51310_c0_seq1:163-834(+)
MAKEPRQASIERVYKILVIGDGLVGKTSFVERYVNNRFVATYKPTLGVDFSQKKLFRGDEVLKLQLWDIMGQEDGHIMTRVYYRGAAGCLLMFDLTQRQSFVSVEKWKKDLDSKVRWKNKKVPTLLVGNKSDVAHRCVTKQELQESCKELDFIDWISTSVKDNRNVAETVSRLVDHLVAIDTGCEAEDEPNRSVIDVGKRQSYSDSSGIGCCLRPPPQGETGW